MKNISARRPTTTIFMDKLDEDRNKSKTSRRLEPIWSGTVYVKKRELIKLKTKCQI